MTNAEERPLRILFSCTGIGVENRGIESFFREAFDNLHDLPGTECRLVRGRGRAGHAETVAACLHRDTAVALILGRLTGRSAYAVEQWTSLPSVVCQIRRFRPDVVFTSEANLGFLLRRFRRRIGVQFQWLYSNGGPCSPPFDRHDIVHQVAPFYLQQALDSGEDPNRHFMVPYGIRMREPPAASTAEKKALRHRLDIPTARPVVLSVGWISKVHKRMDYVINEVAQLPEPRPYLQLLGAMDVDSEELVALAEERLGPGNFNIRSVSYEEVAPFYQVADLFVLASLQEGFGRVYLEALCHGLPVIAHRHPVMEYVLGDQGTLADLSQPGELAAQLTRQLSRPGDEPSRLARWTSVRDRFGWDTLRPEYLRMFQWAKAATKSVAP
jgi:glycosyltransferase involved in cell wall biosynthesis